MSNSSLVNYTKISPNRTSPRKNTIKKITIHHMAGNLTVETCGNVFAPTSRQASANYGIGTDGRVGMYVEEKDRAWTSSNADNDNQAITIEVANNSGEPNWTVSDSAFNKLIELCVDICKRNNIPKLVWTGDKTGTLTCHYMFAATSCPGPYLKSRMAEIADIVNAQLEASTSAPPDTSTSSVMYRVRKSWDDASSQIGAFTVLDNAKKLVDSNLGYFVYDEIGKQVYPEVSTASKPDSSASNKTYPTVPFTVRVLVDDLNIRTSPSSADNINLTGEVTGKGTFTITKVQGNWGYLKSGAGWIYLGDSSYCTVRDAISNSSNSSDSTVTKEIVVGSIVRLKNGAKTYDGKNLASFVYTRDHAVSRISGDRVVITYQDTIVAAVKKSDLILVK